MSENDLNTNNEMGEMKSGKPRFRLPAIDSTLQRLLIITVAIFIIFSVILPDKFPTAASFDAMSVQFPEFGILAVAIMVAMITGGIDLSVTNIAVLAGILAAKTMVAFIPPNTPVPTAQAAPVMLLAVIVALATGLFCGLINGILVAVVNIAPILTTLGTMTLFSGISIVITGGTAIFGFPEQFLFLGEGDLFNMIPMPLVLFTAIVIVMAIVLNRTPYGLKLYMLGSNARASRFSGVNNRGVLIRTYMISGLLAAIAGLLFIARTNSAKEDYGSSYVMLSILIAVLGGVNPNGGFGKISGLVLAVLSMQFISTGLSMLLIGQSGSNFFKEFAWGALLLVVMMVDYVSTQRRLRGSPIKKPVEIKQS